MNIDIVYGVFGVAGGLIFWRCRPALATLIVFLGGWLLLPVGHYPAGSAEAVFPYWIIGLALPSDMLLTKAWIAPATALLGVALFDRPTLRRLRPVWLDLPLVLWCVWPLLQAPLTNEPRPAGWIASLYLTGCWGLPWLLGRLYFSTPAAQLLLVKGLAVSALVCLPIALLEGVAGPVLYGWLYEPHPFRFDGIQRYLGLRPLGFFEDGNQYGLWVSLCALAALWLAVAQRRRSAAPASRRPRLLLLAGATSAIALAAQSLGALLMLGLGGVLLSAARVVRPRRLIVGGVAVLIAVSAVYLSGVVPIRRLATDSALGQRVVAGFKAAGRGSFTWRISQDQKVLKVALVRPIIGQARWDWWRSQQMRPWGLAMLVLGQFGLIGLGLWLGSLLLPALQAVWPLAAGDAWSAAGLPLLLAVLIALTVLDGLLNSFIFFPAVLIAGGLAGMRSARS